MGRVVSGAGGSLVAFSRGCVASSAPLRLLLILLQVCLAVALATGCAAPGSDAAGEAVGTTSSELTGVTLKSIAVTPTPTTLYAGATQALTATGTYSNATTQNLTGGATWTSSNTAIATVSAAGVVTAVTNGTATITAQSGTIKGHASIKVSVTLKSVAVTPPTPTLAANTTQALVATGTYSNSTTKNLTATVTWSSSNPAVATVSSAGLVLALGPGTTTISATTSASAAAPVTGTATITVSSATVASVAVTPATKKLPKGSSQQFTATATFSDGTQAVLSPAVVTWASSAPAIATISASGLATGVAIGSTTVTATHTASGVSGAASLTVTAATLVSVAVTPPADGSSRG